MKGFVTNVEKEALENENFRRVLFTSKNMQLVVMSLLPGEDIGEEVHDLDQFIRVEEGSCKAVIDGEEHHLSDGSAIIIPAGSKHNLINISQNDPLKLYTIYAPPNHRVGTVHPTKADAEANEEHFDGRSDV